MVDKVLVIEKSLPYIPTSHTTLLYVAIPHRLIQAFIDILKTWRDTRIDSKGAPDEPQSSHTWCDICTEHCAVNGKG